MAENDHSRSTLDRLIVASAVAFLVSVLTLVQAYAAIKFVFLVLFVIPAVAAITLRKRPFVVYPWLACFYLSMCIAGSVWAIVGLLHPGNYMVGVFDAVRLYCIWSVAFLLLYTVLRAEPVSLFHRAMVVSGLVISVINFVGLADEIGGWSLIPSGVREELELRVGFHDGYIQLTSGNIGSLFLIVPYLLSLQLRSDAGRANSALTRLSCLLSLALAAVSGRRGLWLVIALTPLTILMLAHLTRTVARFRPWGLAFLRTYAVAVALVALSAPVLARYAVDNGTLGHVMEAFSSQDERTIEKPFLIDGFLSYPLLGSGFGAAAAYKRNDEKPWTGYELSYYLMLYNLGIAGVGLLGAICLAYFVRVTMHLRRWATNSAIPFGLFVALCSLMIGGYSNLYFFSFDLLLFIGLLPYLSTFSAGFDAESTSASYRGPIAAPFVEPVV